MGRDLQLLKLKIQNDTVTVVYSYRRPTLPPLYIKVNTLQQIYWTKVQ